MAVSGDSGLRILKLIRRQLPCTAARSGELRRFGPWLRHTAQHFGAAPMGHIGVVDMETTGLHTYRHDRIVEMAVVVVSQDDTIVREFASLINPERDVGPTQKHGLTASDVLKAPTFRDLAGRLLDTLRDCGALAAHNAEFDVNFLKSEFDLIGVPFPACPAICTMQLAGGGKLVECCAHHGIELGTNAHHAISDARAAARLLMKLLRHDPEEAARLFELPAIEWPDVPQTQVGPMSREQAQHIREEERQHMASGGPVLTQDALRGRTVCFTGDLQCRLDGVRITDEMARLLAMGAGMDVAPRVTRKVNFLIAADPCTQSGNARKARRYSIPILSELVFWNAIGLRVE